MMLATFWPIPPNPQNLPRSPAGAPSPPQFLVVSHGVPDSFLDRCAGMFVVFFRAAGQLYVYQHPGTSTGILVILQVWTLLETWRMLAQIRPICIVNPQKQAPKKLPN